MRTAQLVMADGGAQLWGGEAVLIDGGGVGEVGSGAYDRTLGASVALCLLRGGEPLTMNVLRAGSLEVDHACKKQSATVRPRSPYDPAGARPKVAA